MTDRDAPETWFHIIGGNASKAGLSADLNAIAEAGIGGIQFFHGGSADEPVWPSVCQQIPCLSPQWQDLVAFAAKECHRLGLSFKMQNCPGWSMSGGPWITPGNSMRKLVCFSPDNVPEWNPDDDYHEIARVDFDLEDSHDGCVTFPNPQQVNHGWAYDPDAEFVLTAGTRELWRRRCPAGAWSDDAGLTFRVPEHIICAKGVCARVESSHFASKPLAVTFLREPRLDNWESKAGWGLRQFSMGTNATPVRTHGVRRLIFGHVNARRKNHPAPIEGTGWECDKMDGRGFTAVFENYVGKLVSSGVRVDGMLVDSWECGPQTWTWRMEREFEKRSGYSIRPWLPALFGYVLRSEAETERFLLDWRNVCSRLIEENYYAVIARLAHENDMSVQYETAFGDVIVGDLMRYWKFSDEPMCEFWTPFDNRGGFVTSHNFKPVKPCVSAAHVYGKRRVSAEALTSFHLTFDEDFNVWKRDIDRHFARGVTHIVFHTYTHNPVVGGKPPSASFGNAGIGSPFLREQTWWPFLKNFTRYLSFCGHELERGMPVVDILMYLGDSVGHKPDEGEELFGNRYKVDYLNYDALMSRISVKNGSIVLPDGMSYRVLWLPKCTWLTEKSRVAIDLLEKKGARVIRGDFTPDWPSPLELIGENPPLWYQRYDCGENIFFCADGKGGSKFVYVNDRGRRDVYPVEPEPSGGLVIPLELRPTQEYPDWSTQRSYEGILVRKEKGAKKTLLSLGEVRSWACVFVNGEKLADLWCSPYVCDISSALQPGTNAISVVVTSSWHNRLVHDAGIPDSKRKTWTLRGPSAQNAYRRSGLIGPVSIREVE